MRAVLCDWCWTNRASGRVGLGDGLFLDVCASCAGRVARYRLSPGAVAGCKAGGARRAAEGSELVLVGK